MSISPAGENCSILQDGSTEIPKEMMLKHTEPSKCALMNAVPYLFVGGKQNKSSTMFTFNEKDFSILKELNKINTVLLPDFMTKL